MHQPAMEECRSCFGCIWRGSQIATIAVKDTVVLINIVIILKSLKVTHATIAVADAFVQIRF